MTPKPARPVGDGWTPDAAAPDASADADNPDGPAAGVDVVSGRRHVVVMSIDGCRPDALVAAQATNLIRFGAEGVIAAQAYTIPLSLTLPSHSSMLSGYDMEHHGVNWNTPLPELGFIKVPTIFAIAHAAGMRTVMIMGKAKFLTLQLPDSLDEVHEVGYDDDGIAETAIFVAQKGNFDLLFIHLPNPDLVGHASGWMSPAYLERVAHVDQLFARIKAALPADSTMIVTADHGGHDFGHGADVEIDRHIPWMISGPGIRKHVVVDSPIATMATAATALKLLGLQLGPDAQGLPVEQAFAP
jgi:arylsulfatase A-like enzyme